MMNQFGRSQDDANKIRYAFDLGELERQTDEEIHNSRLSI